MSFEGSRESHIEGIIMLLIRLPLKAWWRIPLYSYTAQYILFFEGSAAWAEPVQSQRVTLKAPYHTTGNDLSLERVVGCRKY